MWIPLAFSHKLVVGDQPTSDPRSQATGEAESLIDKGKDLTKRDYTIKLSIE